MGGLRGQPGPARRCPGAGDLRSLGQRDERDWFSRYAAAALLVAEADLDQVEARGSREDMAETVVIGTVFGDALFPGFAVQRRSMSPPCDIPYRPSPNAHPPGSEKCP